MWTVIIIVGLAIAMMLGPIMMMQPSKRQRRLAQVRASAEALGLKVRMASMPPKSVRAGEEVAVYCQPWPGKKPLKTTWLVARQPFGHGLHFAGEWDWAGQQTAPEPWHEPLRSALADVPAGVLAVEASAHAIGVYWIENIGEQSPEQATEKIANWLEDLISSLPKLERREPYRPAT